ncbi:ABC-type transporter, integral membrane subunit [Caldithrix abyssi DSM 13497]|uniref:ABC-type transporter, integral membrane subunit n=1 Tax=Caldithrix abyssi DSM 13497 TaxID=880073 RepID=H1XSH5_CALAY|nr:iron chelate uptake ABC transporter family permease subunit [Caldithrix abyssi]APF17258.1 manganese/zinc/iron transport system permease protein [Caldithrix abyssi DSM 13497]EHO41387.1 ABC-type transporter, integral membrane subunit [Caldithrix abyssi DSM 13497]
MFDLIQSFISDYTFRTVAMGSGVLGILSGALGSFAVLRRQSLLGDAISHAALPGIALAFLLTRSKAPLVLLLGAALAGWLATLLILAIVRNTRIKDDSALGLVLASFFGFGLVLLTFIQKQPYANQAGLETFLFGQAAALLARDVITMAVLSLITLTILGIFWKEFKLISFDPEFGQSLGVPVRLFDVLLTSLLVVAIVVGLQTVGVVLMSAMVVAPAAAARQWTDRLSLMTLLAGFFGALAGISGAIISSMFAKLPTGPTIVVCMSFIVAFSLMFAANRGIFWRWLQERRNRRRLELNAVLSDLYALADQHADHYHAHPIQVLRTMSIGHGGVDRSLKELRARGWVEQTPDGAWRLTEIGYQAAKKVVEQGREVAQ